MEGLGVGVGAIALAFWAEPHADTGRPRHLCIDCQVSLCFTSRSVPEPIRVWHSLGELPLTSRAAVGERLAEGRAATTRLAPWLKNLPTMA